MLGGWGDGTNNEPRASGFPLSRYLGDGPSQTSELGGRKEASEIYQAFQQPLLAISATWSSSTRSRSLGEKETIQSCLGLQQLPNLPRLPN